MNYNNCILRQSFWLLLVLLANHLNSQNALVGTGFSSGWGGGSCPTGNGNFAYMTSHYGSTFGNNYKANNTGNQYFRFGIDWSGTTAQRTMTSGSDTQVVPKTIYTLQNTCTTSGAMYCQVPNVDYNYYFKTAQGGTNPNGKFIFFEIHGGVVSPTSLYQSPSFQNVTPSDSVLVTVTTSGQLSQGQGIYLRYTTNNWVSSTIKEMDSNPLSHTASIPSQVVGTNVQYYVFTSGSNMIISHNDADLCTINGINNGGSNYSYLVTNTPIVQVNPINPLDNQSITIQFNATGTALAGASKIYLHAGVSVLSNNPRAFSYAVGNWGQDDGIGEMALIGPNLWQIVIPSNRNYFMVPDQHDIFGLNFLFRNSEGTIKEDNGGQNHFHSCNPGNYFLITNPLDETILVEVGSQLDIEATSNIAPTTWLLHEVDEETNQELMLITSINGGVSFSHTLSITGLAKKKYKLSAEYAGEPIKNKFRTVQGYLPVVDLSRPAWTKPGINYHDEDSTKVTLVLHCPTYTRYKKGTGIISGTNTSEPKDIVFVVGDFNNWTISESYKLYRDKDGWNGSIDSDNDGDHGDYWWITLDGLVPNQEYIFQYNVNGNLMVADPFTNKVSDFDDANIDPLIFPNLIDYPAEAKDRASIIQTNQDDYQWKADQFAAPSINDLNIYELHFRDFTEEGTYLAAIEHLDYIKGLGINAIHVMPISEFEGNSSWGYNPNFYFAADKAYGTANDLKTFIDECHKRKILVFNDLVLNHSFHSNVHAKLYWNEQQDKPANDNPWFNPEHKMIANPAGWWGVDWNHESEHTQNVMDRILDYWIQEFKFDGFRFDFTKGIGQTAQDPNDEWASSYDQDRIDLLTRLINGMKARNPGAIAIFEHLAASEEDKTLADQGILMWSGVGHHNDIKNLILGYNTDNTNIYNSGVYNASGRNFNFAHWMSYGESHDEERLGYEVTQYYNGVKSLENIVERLKIAVGFNLLLPGPRMVWQFQELGYDISINFNGRTGEKPVHWEYFDDLNRKELHNIVSRLFKIRNTTAIYSTTPDYGNIGLGAGNITIPRVMRLSSSDNKHVIVVANIDPNNGHNVMPNYDVTGTWYRYNGVFDESPLQVTNVSTPYFLNPNEMMVFTNFKIDNCTDVRSTGDNGDYTLRNAIVCAQDGDHITIEYPLYNDTIQLDSAIIINKNISIDGFFTQKVHINGNNFDGTVFSIGQGKTVTISGLTVSCANGNSQGRCLVNNGNLTLDNISMHDDDFGIGLSIQNEIQGNIIIRNTVKVIH